MNAVLDAFWRSVAYCLHPKVILWSFLPLVLMVGVTAGLGYFYLDALLDTVHRLLESMDWLQMLWAWLESMGVGKLKTVLVPLLVILVLTPVVVVACLLVVATLMAPMLVGLVGKRRFPELEKQGSGSYLLSVGWALVSTLAALLALIISLPLWLIPPLVLVLPPLIWGWLTYRVMAFDALSDYATRAERQVIFERHRWPLLAMGVFAGYLGAAPSLVWSFGFVAVALAPVLVPVSIWLYTLLFAFSSLWFTHYGLKALQDLRAEATAVVMAPPVSLDVVDVEVL
ncbi:EI24 domain-containing protein [Rhodoferax sp.]|uniref:EI24 domain-containing protein n=1 Tax=Rhodoferax sp. TaxID=50421 RepID=UPI0025D686CC|nr:EI24 domain-containing protein [Rhodoferax sp.]